MLVLLYAQTTFNLPQESVIDIGGYVDTYCTSGSNCAEANLDVSFRKLFSKSAIVSYNSYPFSLNGSIIRREIAISLYCCMLQLFHSPLSGPVYARLFPSDHTKDSSTPSLNPNS